MDRCRVQMPPLAPAPTPAPRPRLGPPVHPAALPPPSAWLRLFSQFSSLPPSNTNLPPPSLVGPPPNSLATLRPHSNSGDLTLGSVYNPGEVTGRCQGNGRVQIIRKAGTVGRGRCGPPKAPTRLGSSRSRASSLGVGGCGPLSPGPLPLSRALPLCGRRMDSPGRGAVRGGVGPAPASAPPLPRPLTPLRPRRAAPARRAAVWGRRRRGEPIAGRDAADGPDRRGGGYSRRRGRRRRRGGARGAAAGSGAARGRAPPGAGAPRPGPRPGPGRRGHLSTQAAHHAQPLPAGAAVSGEARAAWGEAEGAAPASQAREAWGAPGSSLPTPGPRAGGARRGCVRGTCGPGQGEVGPVRLPKGAGPGRWSGLGGGVCGGCGWQWNLP